MLDGEKPFGGPLGFWGKREHWESIAQVTSVAELPTTHQPSLLSERRELKMSEEPHLR